MLPSRCLLLAAIAFGITACNPVSPDKSKDPPPVKAAAEPVGPWPECPEVVRYIKEHLGEPGSLEIVEWKTRQLLPDKEGVPIVANITVRYRARNDRGAMQSFLMEVNVNRGKATSMWPTE